MASTEALSRRVEKRVRELPRTTGEPDAEEQTGRPPGRHRAPPATPPLRHNAPMTDRELNFARTILGDRNFREVPDEEVLREAERLLSEWMSGEARLERPKLYDHYALLLVALTRRVRDLEARLSALEAGR